MRGWLEWTVHNEWFWWKVMRGWLEWTGCNEQFWWKVMRGWLDGQYAISGFGGK